MSALLSSIRNSLNVTLQFHKGYIVLLATKIPIFVFSKV